MIDPTMHNETNEDSTASTSTSGSTQQAQPAAAPPLLPGLQPPAKLELGDGNLADNWKAYKQVWSNYSIIANIGAQQEAYRVVLFLHCIGPDTLKIYNGFAFENATDKQCLTKIFEKFDQYTIGEINETYERFHFNIRKQDETESFDAYLTSLRTLAKTCGFCECLHDSLVRDRIVMGVRDNRLCQRLLQERKLDLKRCTDMCRSSEMAASQM